MSEQKKEMNASVTGALRDNKGKLPLSWVPLCILEAIASVLYRNSVSGGGKYPDHNWQKGAPYSVPMDSLLRHAFKRAKGELVDPDDGLPHTWKILTNAAFLVFYEKMYPTLDDLKVNTNLGVKVNYRQEMLRTCATPSLLNAVLGLAGEAGEVADLYKKFLIHGHELNKEKLILELGDIRWYLELACECLGTTVEEIELKNVEKLRKRYPEGFSTRASLNRE